MVLQEKLMNYMFNSFDLARSWRDLLQREYAFPTPTAKSGWGYLPLLGLTSTQ